MGYDGLRGHMIVLPQDPAPLLKISPSPMLELNTIIKVAWIGPGSIHDLKPHLEVRKQKVLNALVYLKDRNRLYREISINQETLTNGLRPLFLTHRKTMLCTLMDQTMMNVRVINETFMQKTWKMICKGPSQAP